MKIIFMGTPDYAVKTLQSLISAGHEVAAVFCQPDKPVGRKHIITPPPVKICAAENGIPVFQPKTLKDGEIQNTIAEIAPDVIVVVAYGKLLPNAVLDIPKYGCVNGHASLLPKYRGASPIQWCIVCGETETGVTTMLMDEGMDTGDILEVKKVKIGETETAEELFERLSGISSELMVSTLKKLENGEITPVAQNHGEATYAPIIKKEMAHIDFTKLTADEVCCHTRGYYSWPCAYFFLEGKRIKLIKVRNSDKTYDKPGCIVENGDELIISCKDKSCVSLEEIQAEGSKPMTAKQFLCGKKPQLGFIDGNEDA